MLVIKSKDLVEDVAKHCGIPADHVNKIARFYYRTIRIQMEELASTRFLLTGLGHFGIQGWQLYKELEKAEKVVARKASPVTREKALEEKDKIQKALAMWEKEEVRRKEITKKKNDFKNESKRLSKKSLGE